MVIGATRGDVGAMRALLRWVAPIVARTARRVMGRNHPEVEDVAQQALSAFVERLSTFRNESSITHFAERITVYRALTARRDAAVRGRFIVADGELLEAVADDAAARSAEGEAADSACRALLLRALDAIAPPQAEALALHFLFDYTVSEIAETAGVPDETVRSRLRLGKQALRALIEREPSLAALREHLS
jgi:RNA polymerase sigma-70 factor (ECF subfamily)